MEGAKRVSTVQHVVGQRARGGKYDTKVQSYVVFSFSLSFLGLWTGFTLACSGSFSPSSISKPMRIQMWNKK